MSHSFVGQLGNYSSVCSTQESLGALHQTSTFSAQVAQQTQSFIEDQEILIEDMLISSDELIEEHLKLSCLSPRNSIIEESNLVSFKSCGFIQSLETAYNSPEGILDLDYEEHVSFLEAPLRRNS